MQHRLRVEESLRWWSADQGVHDDARQQDRGNERKGDDQNGVLLLKLASVFSQAAANGTYEDEEGQGLEGGHDGVAGV